MGSADNEVNQQPAVAPPPERIWLRQLVEDGLIEREWSKEPSPAPYHESFEYVRVQATVDEQEQKCSNPHCLEGWVDEEEGSQDGRESYVSQVPCQVCCVHCDETQEQSPLTQVDVLLRIWVPAEKQNVLREAINAALTASRQQLIGVIKAKRDELSPLGIGAKVCNELIAALEEGKK